jgi:hypothetical protein
MAVTSNYGAAPTYVKIASQTLTSTAASITFSNIPQGYTDLVLVMNYFSTASEWPMIQFNSDTATNYSFTEMYGNGSSPASVRQSSVSGIWVGYGAYSPAGSTNPGTIIINIKNYANATTYKTTLSRSNSTNGVEATVGLWRSTSAINTIVLKHQTATTYMAGSTFTLYGIKAAFVPKATGGDVIVQDGSYWYHAFRTTGAFVPRQALTADVLVIAGGGSGGNFGGAGGGAGGLLALTSQSISTAQTVTIGAGGAGVVPSGRQGNSGSNSVFGSSTATGGGGGGAESSNGKNGGSGGGAGGGAGGPGTGTGGTGVSGQGFRGGNGSGAGDSGGAGGGGAGAVGANGTGGETGGNGGVGTNTYSTWATATSTGASGYYAGGGGGATGTGVGGGTGGLGGGTGGHSGTNATANTGGGGGARWNGGTSSAGGSGIVIVRYAI